MSESTAATAPGPTVALLHGAFADSTSWTGVIERLTAAGVRAQAVPNPLRGLVSDSAYVASALGQIPGPVVAVGHSYGGAVITNAAARAGNVVGLVYVAAFAPDEGETLASIEQGSTDSVLNSSVVERTYPIGNDGETAVEFAIDPAKFHDAFAADLSPEQAAVMAATQRPVSTFGFTEPTGVPAWRSLPCWAVVATGDKAAGTDVVRSMARRAGMTITEVEGSHVFFIAQPQTVADVILQALGTLSRADAAAPGGAASAV